MNTPYPPTPAEVQRATAERTTAEPPPAGYGWSLAWGPSGRRPDLDALVPVHPGARPTDVLVALSAARPDVPRLVASCPDDLAAPGVLDRLQAYASAAPPVGVSVTVTTEGCATPQHLVHVDTPGASRIVAVCPYPTYAKVVAEALRAYLHEGNVDELAGGA